MHEFIFEPAVARIFKALLLMPADICRIKFKPTYITITSLDQNKRTITKTKIYLETHSSQLYAAQFISSLEFPITQLAQALKKLKKIPQLFITVPVLAASNSCVIEQYIQFRAPSIEFQFQTHAVIRINMIEPKSETVPEKEKEHEIEPEPEPESEIEPEKEKEKEEEQDSTNENNEIVLDLKDIYNKGHLILDQ
jgi:hypothetical protein